MGFSKSSIALVWVGVVASLSVPARASGTVPCENRFQDLNAVIEEMRIGTPALTAGETPAGGTRDVFRRFFAGLPLPLELPLNTEKLMTLQERTGESRPGIGKIWSSRAVLRNVLDLSGSFGPYSPIGMRLGPVGDSPTQPWFWWKRLVEGGAWHFAPRDLMEAGGPLNARTGILSEIGPDADDWAQGNFNILGTNSFAGPKGLLGPLGPMGALPSMQEVTLDASGLFLDSKTHGIVRSIMIQNGRDSRKYDVFEKLSANFTERASENWLLDSSYLVDSHLSRNETTKVFRSTAPNSEIVSAIVVPDIGTTTHRNISWWPKRLNFNIRVLTEDGSLIVSSELKEKVNLVQFQIRKGEKYQIEVTPQGQTYWGEDQNFRVIVSGATSDYGRFLWEDILGPEFAHLWSQNSQESELALTYLWSDMMQETFRQYKSAIRSGQSTQLSDPVGFWKQTVSKSMERLHDIEGSALSPEEKRARLVASMEKAVKEFQTVVTDDPMSGDEMLHMWKQLMANTASSQEDLFNLNRDAAAAIPLNWLHWMNATLETYKRAAGVPPRE